MSEVSDEIRSAITKHYIDNIMPRYIEAALETINVSYAKKKNIIRMTIRWSGKNSSTYTVFLFSLKDGKLMQREDLIEDCGGYIHKMRRPVKATA